MGLFSGELIIGGSFALQNGFGLTIKPALNTKIIASNGLKRQTRQFVGLYSGGLIIGRIFASEI